MGLDEAVTAGPGRLVAGFGFRHAAEPDEILALVQAALDAVGHPVAALAALATAVDRAGESPIREAAARLALPLRGIAPEALRAADARVVTRSARMAAERGIGSLAEAAALAACGPTSRLLLPRIAGPRVTCALAVSRETP
ncbi:cobalamin biosynthesis protein [Methylobacterium organophilum]|uniref:CobE/GbiG C-terminal domain-containing protein n=1 Tax=Methylobacterium organophilum TaxID=410 RepID=A0ABQ4T5V4_METOR|nr:cobalamin biosynthesis protein [Methylobacterium organophilum]GJE25626.1 hypothetical protein LKMONMHP_0464 [Methylobacterium organophilum]